MLKPHRSLTAILILAAVMTTTACAAQTYRYPGAGPNGGYNRELERRGYDYGYRDGQRAGERDARSGRPFSFNRHDEWRDADDGYGRGYGGRELYRRSFRNGFESGYTDAYNRYGNYGRAPRGGSYPTYPTYPNGNDRAVPRGSLSPAAQNGFRDGVEAGGDDARGRHAFDPVRAKRYREGDHDFDNRYGSREEYKREYRAAFQQGYEEGYRAQRR
jgi:hypothetical protein